MENKGTESGERWPSSVDYLLRTTQQHHVQLSLIADQKASILIGATFVVFTLALRDGLTGDLSVASFILACFSFLSAALGVMAIIPSIKKRGAPTGNNSLFFGTFAEIEEDAYIDDMIERLGDRERVYRMMLRDIHQNGSVLYRKKYRFLTYAFRIFLVGLVMSFAAYLIEVAIAQFS